MTEGLSSFMNEIKDITTIINNINSSSNDPKCYSLVCLDELGMNCAIEVGLPMSWAICEYFLALDRV